MKKSFWSCRAPERNQVIKSQSTAVPSCGPFYGCDFVYSWDLLAVICVYHVSRHHEQFWRRLWTSDLQRTIVLAFVLPGGLQRPAPWLAGVLQPLLSSVLHYFRKHGQMRPTNYICEFNMQISPMLACPGPPGTCPAVFLQLRPEHESNLARETMRDAFVLVTGRQTTQAGRRVNDRGSEVIKEGFNRCKLFLILW